MERIPPSPGTPPTVALRRVAPGAASGAWLTADTPAARWQEYTARDLLLRALPPALDELQRHPGGVLVGLLPYPGRASANEDAATPATLLLFSGFRLAPDLPPAAGAFRLTRHFSADTPRAGYEAGVRRIQEYLAAGDAYQVNLAQRFSACYEGNAWKAFVDLASSQPPPHAAWMDLGDRQLLSFSPESFVEVCGRQVTTRPIKGTRPRGLSAEQDALLAADLASHPKDRAENLMIVDLLRNDLGRVCVPGSVKTPTLFALESFRNVHHLVSTVSGTLAEGTGPAELLAATFPGGSITGAPKKRAMEIIDELETHPRDAYCGNLFWITADGRMGSNILIRSFVAGNGHLRGWAGAGIVADSDPALEYQECLDKLQGLMDAFASISD